MLTVVFILGSFLLLQFGAVNANTSSFNTLMVVFGFYWSFCSLVGWMARNYRINEISAQIEPVWKRYQAKYGDQTVRNSFTEFGSGFGDGFAEAAAASGDVIGTLIGAGISAISGIFGNAKSPEQRQMESVIAAGIQQIEEAKSRFFAGHFLFTATTAIFIALSRSGSIPIR